MKKRETRRRAGTGNWFVENWQYLLLLGAIAITAFLVVLAFTRPTPSSGTVRHSAPEAAADGLETTSTPTPSATAVTTKPVVAFLGDSYAAGEGTDGAGPRWTSILSVSQGWTEVNISGIGSGYGTESDDGILSYAGRVGQVIAAAPEIVIVSGGRFDYSGTTTRIEISESIVETFGALRAGLPNTRIIALGPIWDASSPPPRLAEIGAEVKSAVTAVGGSFIDIGQPLAGRPELLAPDGVNANEDGHVFLSAAIANAIATVLETAD